MIEQLTLTSFRGSTQRFTLRFAPHTNVALIYGENGAGKSTIVDAIDFICNQQLGSIADRSGAAAARNIVALDATAQQLEVRLVYNGATWRATLNGRSVQVTPENPPRALVLRRADITRLMEAQPAERYKALQAFITAPHIEQSEAALRTAQKSVANDVEQAQQSLDAALRSLTTLWQNEGSPLAEPVAWARARTREDMTAIQSRLDALRTLQDLFRDTERLRTEARTNALELAQVRNDLEVAQAAVSAEERGAEAIDAQLVRLLEEAQRYLQGTHGSDALCPLCGKPEPPAQMLARIEAALARAAALRQLLENQTAVETRRTELTAIQTATRAAYIQRCHALADPMAYAPVAFKGAVDAGALAGVDESNDALRAAKAALDALASRAHILAAAVDEEQKTLNQLTALRTYLNIIAQAEAVLQEQQAVKNQLSAFLSVVEEERKRYVDDLLRRIGAQVNQFYAAIHPGEALGSSSISVKSTGKASLELKARFADQGEVAPGAFYSEGHLDTLGLCIYLAMAKNAGTGGESTGSESIVVLDDVLGSLDEIHLRRVVDLLAAEAPHIGHLIITTPSHAWLDLVHDAGDLDADVIELGEWDLRGGIQLRAGR